MVFGPEVFSFFDQFFSFLCSAICFHMLSSLFSLFLLKAENRLQKTEQGMHRAELEKANDFLNQNLSLRNIFGAFYADV